MQVSGLDRTDFAQRMYLAHGQANIPYEQSKFGWLSSPSLPPAGIPRLAAPSARASVVGRQVQVASARGSAADG
jgi:hypothetical protein